MHNWDGKMLRELSWLSIEAHVSTDVFSFNLSISGHSGAMSMFMPATKPIDSDIYAHIGGERKN